MPKLTYANDGICHNVEPGTFGHECGKPAKWIGTTKASFSSGFCKHCRENGFEAYNVASWCSIGDAKEMGLI